MQQHFMYLKISKLLLNNPWFMLTPFKSHGGFTTTQLHFDVTPSFQSSAVGTNIGQDALSSAQFGQGLTRLFGLVDSFGC
jgi:hypothetical protein